MVCLTCRRPLTSIHDEHNPQTPTVWVHVNPADHPTVPIPRREALELTLVCDFCNNPHTLGEGVVFEADPFRLETDSPVPRINEPGHEMSQNLAGAHHVTWQDDGLGWGACARCAPLIRGSRWDYLRGRCITSLHRQHPERTEELLHLMVDTAHDAFRRTWTGKEHPAGLIEPPREE